jgi:hypothetical protein
LNCFYFGCWNQAGHYLHLPGGYAPIGLARHSRGGYAIEWVGNSHLDSGLAPQQTRDLGIVFHAQGAAAEEAIRRSGQECPQGQFLRHVLPSGYTAIAWWDRTQGDTRGACNSTILLEGEHTSEVMLAALAEHFPSVLANLKRAGVELVEVFATGAAT